MGLTEKKSFIKNYIFAASAVFLQIGVLQLFIMPVMSKYMSENDYGLMLTIVSIVNMLSITLGSNLLNVRLITLSEYKDNGFVGDFNLLCVAYTVVASILSVTVSAFFVKKISILLLFVGLFSAVSLCSTYSMVTVRLKKEFKLDIVASICMVVGFSIGFVLFRILNIWPLVYICGYLGGFVYYSNCFKRITIDGFKRTRVLGKTNKRVLELTAADFIRQLMTYADRIVLYPLSGGSTVAVYYAATLMGKCVTLAANPLCSLILSYLTDTNTSVRKRIMTTFAGSMGVCFILYWVCLIISDPLLMLLYPQYHDRSMTLIKITTATAMVAAVGNIMCPFILRYYNAALQIVISTSSVIVYFISIYFLYSKLGIKGFCIAGLIAESIKIVLYLLICTTSSHTTN